MRIRHHQAAPLRPPLEVQACRDPRPKVGPRSAQTKTTDKAAWSPQPCAGRREEVTREENHAVVAGVPKEEDVGIGSVKGWGEARA